MEFSITTSKSFDILNTKILLKNSLETQRQSVKAFKNFKLHLYFTRLQNIFKLFF